MRLLLVEPDTREAGTLKAAMEHAGYEVDVAFNPWLGSARVNENDYDVIVVDEGAPPRDGCAFVHALRSAGVPTPILLLYGARDGQTEIAGLNAGADDLMFRPFDVRELLARLRALARIRRDRWGWCRRP